MSKPFRFRCVFSAILGLFLSFSFVLSVWAQVKSEVEPNDNRAVLT